MLRLQSPSKVAAMQRLVFGFILLWIVHAAVAVAVDRESVHSHRLRILQSFGVVDGPSPTSKPNLPPIFAPVAVPINARPVSKPASSTTKPIPAPTSGFGNGGGGIGTPVRSTTRPVSSPTSGFGNGGGGTVTIDDTPPTTTPIAKMPSTVTAPTLPNVTDLQFPTSTPTSGSGAVILDEPTISSKIAPTIAPIVVALSTQPVPSSWLSFVVTYTSELYTVVQDPKNVQEILRTVHGDVRKSLSHLIKQQNVAIIIELLESELLGICPGSVNVTNPNDLVFPNFPICNDVRARIVTKIDSTKVSESTVRDSFIKHINESFIPFHNKNSTISRLRYMEPINVSATLNITMVGAPTEMNPDESKLFVEMTRTVLLGLFLNGTESNRITPMNLEFVKVLHQHSRNNVRKLQSISENDNFNGQPANVVAVLITTSCTRHRTCSDAALQTFLNELAPPYGAPLMALLVANSQYFYFDDLRLVIIGEQIKPVLPPSKVPDVANQEEIVPEKMPVWIISLILVICVIFTTTIIYIIFRRRVRRLKGDSNDIRDGIKKDGDEEKSNMLRHTQFTPSLAPSFQQIQEWSNGNTTQQSYQQQPPLPPPQPQVRDTSIFHKRGQNKAQQPIREYEEEDEYYDDNRYDNDQFSVEAGNFGDNAYDEHQWNSSFRSYT